MSGFCLRLKRMAVCAAVAAVDECSADQVFARRFISNVKENIDVRQ